MQPAAAISALHGGIWTNMSGRSTSRRNELAAQMYLCQQQQIREWMQLVLQRADIAENLSDLLTNGVLLCELIRAINPTMMPNIRDGQSGTNVENIESFLAACRDLSVAPSALFDVADLAEKKNLSAVMRCILALSAQV